jgi:hypothetical protein
MDAIEVDGEETTGLWAEDDTDGLDVGGSGEGFDAIEIGGAGCPGIARLAGLGVNGAFPVVDWDELPIDIDGFEGSQDVGAECHHWAPCVGGSEMEGAWEPCIALAMSERAKAERDMIPLAWASSQEI